MTITQKEEVFAEVAGFPGYRVSDQGRVQSRMGRWSHLRPPGKEWRDMRPNTSARGGYCRVGLYRDGLAYPAFVHLLVMAAFGPPCPEGHECRHLNGNPKDNRLENLAWGTHKENAADMVEHGRSQRGEKHVSAKLTLDKAREIRRMRRAGMSLSKIAATAGVSVPTVHRVVQGRMWVDAIGDSEEGSIPSPSRKSTALRGESIGTTKLTESQVREMMPLLDVLTLNEIAERFGVGFSTVSKIKTGRNWGWLTGRSTAL